MCFTQLGTQMLETLYILQILEDSFACLLKSS